MKKSGLADSPFFSAVPTPPPVLAQKPAVHQRRSETARSEGGQRRHANTQESMQASNNASMHATMQESMIELIRTAVKDAGKESATYRFTPEEKRALLELSFAYKVRGFKTSENELVRIAINSLLEDHRENGKNSVLERVLQALRK